MTDTTIILFRHDLRLQDHAALAAAITSKQRILPLYIFDEDKKQWPMGSASRWWLHHSLTRLNESLNQYGGKLYLRRGDTLAQLETIISDVNANKLYFSRGYEPRSRQIEEAIYQRWHEQIEVKRYGGYLLFEPEQVATGQGLPYKVFTPFWKTCLKLAEPVISKKTTFKQTHFYQPRIHCEKLEGWELLPTNPDWAQGLRDNWQPGEAGAKTALKQFLKQGLVNYDEDRDRPDIEGTSQLSPHLHFGEIAPVRIWHEVKQLSSADNVLQKQALSYLRELAWRDFSNHLLFHWPDLPDDSFKKEYNLFPWAEDKKALIAWQTGHTGFPIVDAGMRQLWHTGWMHNRVRMIVGSLLVKHLLIHWRHGEDWFWDTLVDADMANNAASWQWVAGSGADAAPYFRVFNPILQGKKFDPAGDYVRKWVPELAKLPSKYIHEPWEASSEVCREAEFSQGKSYPMPIIEHKAGRERALAAFKSFNDKR
ncbi:MAG: deoxyribodipyrimidine photo-lyase [Pseudomonadota bacterium]